MYVVHYTLYIFTLRRTLYVVYCKFDSVRLNTYIIRSKVQAINRYQKYNQFSFYNKYSGIVFSLHGRLLSCTHSAPTPIQGWVTSTHEGHTAVDLLLRNNPPHREIRLRSHLSSMDALYISSTSDPQPFELRVIHARECNCHLSPELWPTYEQELVGAINYLSLIFPHYI